MLFAGMISPDFLSPNNLTNILRQSAALGIVTIGQTVVLLTGGADLSVTAIMQLVTVMVAEISRGEDSLIAISVLASLVVGALIGLLNGVIISKRNNYSIIITLAVGLMVTGARLAWTKAAPSGTLPYGLRPLSQGQVLGLPYSLLLFLALTLLASIVLRKTTFGRSVYALGGNSTVARLAGIRVVLIGIIVYLISGLLAALAGLVLAAYIGYIDQWLGGGYDLDSIAAAAIGGVSLAGGKGSVWGSLAGVFLIRMLMNFVIVVGLPIEYQYVVRGAIVVLAVAIYSFRRSR
jgi:ribose/xylose/arabinose/galactoside ABC-type transport system permease subunit